LLDAPAFPVPPATDSSGEVSAETPPAHPDSNWRNSLEVGYVRPHLSGNAAQPGGDLHWVSTPTITLGYLLGTTQKGAAWGLELSYRILAGNNDAPGARGVAVQDRLDSHLFDLDLSVCQDPAPNWGWGCKTGIRIAKIFVDSRIDNGPAWASNSSDCWGGGLHMELRGACHIDHTPFSLFCGVEWAGLIGNNAVMSEGSAGLVTHRQDSRLMDQLGFWAGLQWDLTTGRLWMRLTAGYRFDVWSHDIQISNQQAVRDGIFTAGNGLDTSRAHDDLAFHGPFLRAEIRY
jgi:hypothetical protein